MESMLGRKAHLNLVPTTFRWFVNAAPEEIILLGELRLGRGESVKLATEENFNDLEGTLRLVEQEDKPLEENAPIGQMYYVEKYDDVLSSHKTNYTVDVKISRRRLEPLLAAVNLGRLPSHISIDVEGMTYDWQPDGSGKIWDNKTSPYLPIKSMYFITPLIGGDPHDCFDDRSPEDGMPPSRAQLNQVTAILKQIENKLESVTNRISWLIFFLAILMFAFIWRYR